MYVSNSNATTSASGHAHSGFYYYYIFFRVPIIILRTRSVRSTSAEPNPRDVWRVQESFFKCFYMTFFTLEIIKHN